MKRTYVRPTMVGERFVANEYVAACHDQNTVYKFKCDAPGGWNGKQDSGEGVIVWRGPRNNNGHATTNLDMNTWGTAKS